MDEDLRERVTTICLALPVVEATLTGQHIAYAVRGKKFAYFLIDHHGDGRMAVQCKAPRETQAMLIDADPVRFYMPPYVGPRGWVGIDLGVGEPDWDQIASLLQDAYRMTAPKRLAASIEA